ncbi:MAG TPA: hypothetical protein ENG63_01340 [Candidatus Desulfofervidus auxilii]|uniref:Phosphatidate cytidylyltransferase n=1 Tax=Desulfofervidus auxilii TaxID=1621989 RepID=A0A7C0U1J9_DESA2|nr:hypothetical protein [Candidatus Desulfofervidus auxilii]
MGFLLRKIWHLIGTIIPLIYFFSSLSPKKAALIVFVIFIFVFIGDVLRLFYPPLNKWFLNYFGFLVKEKEKKSITGSTYYLFAISITLFFFPKTIATCAILYLTLGDPIAAIVGHYFPLFRIWQEKSLGGTLANFIVCLNIGFYFFSPFVAIIGAITATLVELFSPIDDAISIPLCSALVLYYVL